MVRVLFTLAVAVATVSAQNIAITGVPTQKGPNGAVPLRREIRDLQSNFPDQFNLFILGLQHFQDMDQQDPQSYYQIAGIHGMPYKAWNGVASTSDWVETEGFGGYCTHSSILFAPWHRPYIALWEQSLYASVQEVASQFPAGELRAKYVAAAKDFRAPYWDWAIPPPSDAEAFPTFFSSPQISVIDTDGNTKTVSNPLHRYTFHPLNPSPGDFDEYWSRWNYTIRYPSDAEFGQSRDQFISPRVAEQQATLRSDVGLLLLSYKNFDAFTYNGFNPDTSPGEYGSLENVHNVIHDLVGGRGHMSYLATSAFDPVFWMHHINVDRLWAIWQDLNPDSFMSPREAPWPSTFSTSWKQIDDRNSPLVPFWDSTSTKFWTSDEIKNSTALFGYAYPETQSWLYNDLAAYQDSIRTTVSNIYQMNVFQSAAASASASASALFKRDSSTSRRQRRSYPVPRASSTATNNTSDSPIPPPLQYLAPNNTYTEYVLNVRTSKLALGQSFRILAFLGPYDTSSPAKWDLEHNLVGRVSIMTRTEDPESNNNNIDPSISMVSGTIPLTSALLQDILDTENPGADLENLTPEKVVPYLKKHLDWKATLFTGEEVDLTEIQRLEVSVASTSVYLTREGVPLFDVHGEGWIVRKEATAGRPGGIADE
ncbi:tyrosinase [Naviculisporaceae sp. PSN 640]